jgi:hypothetical protein
MVASESPQERFSSLGHVAHPLVSNTSNLQAGLLSWKAWTPGISLLCRKRDMGASRAREAFHALQVNGSVACMLKFRCLFVLSLVFLFATGISSLDYARKRDDSATWDEQLLT